jgi:NMD protein affecting ribosome stability and mRNA decay
MGTISNSVYNNSNAHPLLKTCEHCGQPRDNNHDTLCPMCLYRTEIKTWLTSS